MTEHEEMRQGMEENKALAADRGMALTFCRTQLRQQGERANALAAQMAALREATQAVLGLLIAKIAKMATTAPQDESGNPMRTAASDIRKILKRLSPILTDTATAALAHDRRIRDEALEEAKGPVELLLARVEERYGSGCWTDAPTTDLQRAAQQVAKAMFPERRTSTAAGEPSQPKEGTQG